MLISLDEKLCGSSNYSYSMGCTPVRGLSYLQVDKHGITILYHLHQCKPCKINKIFRA